MLKRIAALIILTAILIVSVPFSASAESISTTFTDVNVTRRTDYLVIYTPSYGYYTNTNEYGYEVVVDGGVVTAVGGNNNYIPENGYVVSGHGTNSEWLRANVTLGMKVSYSNSYYSKTITFTSDIDTVKYVVNEARKKAVAAKAYAENSALIYDEDADKRFVFAEEDYNKLTSSSTEEEMKALAEEYNTLATLFREREVSEYRGVWLRPKQTSLAEVEQYVRSCYDSGINLISIETMYDAMMICPMPGSSDYEQNPYFNGFDVLGAFVSAAHRYGIEVHCWMPVFFTGFNYGTYYYKNPAYKHPEWQAKTNNGSSLYSGESSGMLFLNPASSEVQDFLIETYTYILETYDIDGFELDYIRYRDRTSTDDYGYDAETIAAFKAAYPQYQYYNITYNTYAAYWNDWVKFRTSKVTEFVQKMRNLIDEIAPDVILSADVGPSLDSAYSTLYQDSRTWMQNGWLDMIHPMAYGENYSPYIKPFFDYVDQGCQVVPGLGIFMDEFGPSEMVIQAMDMIDIGCNGVIYFESESFNYKKTGQTLVSTLYTEHSVAPSLNNANTIKAILERMRLRLDTAVANGLITWQQGNDVEWTVKNAIAALDINAKEAADEVSYIATTVKTYIPEGDLYNRLLLDVAKAQAATLRDQGIDTVSEGSVMTDEIPSDALGSTQLTIDKVDGAITGEDSSLMTGYGGNYNLGYSYVMLLKPVSGKTNKYVVIEAHENTGSEKAFSTVFESGMLIAAFHSDGVGIGLERKQLAMSVAIGTELTLFGVDLESRGFTSLCPMLYVSTSNEDPEITDPDDPVEPEVPYDINGDGKFNMFDSYVIKNVHFGKISPDAEILARCDVNNDGKINVFDYAIVKRAYFEQ